MTGQAGFPVDDGTLDMLEQALGLSAGSDGIERSHMGEFLRFMSEMAGSDVTAVAEVLHRDADGTPDEVVLRDPQYHEHCVVRALVAEVRRLRSPAGE